MSWTYELITGRLYRENGELVGVGYSGKGANKNNPEAQCLHNEGPIPEGVYHVGTPKDTFTHGPFVLPLTPAPDNLMWSRSGFLVHGDSVVSPGTASEGCIIQSRDVRQELWNSDDHTLEVVKEWRKHEI